MKRVNRVCFFQKSLFFDIFYLSTRRYSSSIKRIDHYRTLGVSPNSSPKEIKAAFFELSKKYHPDVSEKDKMEKSSEIFQNLVDAYEILGSPEKRRIYDMTINRSKPSIILSQQHSATATRKSYTDIDIDYKDFEHFQQSTRRRRKYQNDYEIPEYLKSMGFSTNNKTNNQNTTEYKFKDSLAYQREKEEKRIAAELEEEKRKAKYPLPTFEQLSREKERLNRDHVYAKFKTCLSILFLTIGITLILFRGLHK